LAGWDTAGYDIPFPHLACGTLSLDDLPDLYSQCDVALVLSLTNLSLLPLELMACGCAVVSNRGPNVQWLLHDDVAVLADATPEALTDAVCELLRDDARRAALSARAEALARSQTWDEVARQFEAGLLAAREQPLQGGAPCVA
jgi:glycosyltransferase involved in cell wall biosynthesis